MPEAVADILGFWFGLPGSEDYDRPRALWFRKSSDIDAEIARRFGSVTAAALAGELEAWSLTPDGLLALILLLDQFPRNLYRDQARAFAGDARARELAGRAIAAAWDRTMAPVRRGFLYLPFEHSESPADQAESLRLFRELTAFPETRDLLRWAEAHAAVIARFGRYPHRNAALGRASSAEELDYLRQPGAGF